MNEGTNEHRAHRPDGPREPAGRNDARAPRAQTGGGQAARPSAAFPPWLLRTCRTLADLRATWDGLIVEVREIDAYIADLENQHARSVQRSPEGAQEAAIYEAMIATLRQSRQAVLERVNRNRAHVDRAIRDYHGFQRQRAQLEEASRRRNEQLSAHLASYLAHAEVLGASARDLPDEWVEPYVVDPGIAARVYEAYGRGVRRVTDDAARRALAARGIDLNRALSFRPELSAEAEAYRAAWARFEDAYHRFQSGRVSPEDLERVAAESRAAGLAYRAVEERARWEWAEALTAMALSRMEALRARHGPFDPSRLDRIPFYRGVSSQRRQELREVLLYAWSLLPEHVRRTIADHVTAIASADAVSGCGYSQIGHVLVVAPDLHAVLHESMHAWEAADPYARDVSLAYLFSRTLHPVTERIELGAAGWETERVAADFPYWYTEVVYRLPNGHIAACELLSTGTEAAFFRPGGDGQQFADQRLAEFVLGRLFDQKADTGAP